MVFPSIKNAPFNDMADQVEQAAKVEVNFEVKTWLLDQI